MKRKLTIMDKDEIFYDGLEKFRVRAVGREVITKLNMEERETKWGRRIGRKVGSEGGGLERTNRGQQSPLREKGQKSTRGATCCRHAGDVSVKENVERCHRCHISCSMQSGWATYCPLFPREHTVTGSNQLAAERRTGWRAALLCKAPSGRESPAKWSKPRIFMLACSKLSSVKWQSRFIRKSFLMRYGVPGLHAIELIEI